MSMTVSLPGCIPTRNRQGRAKGGAAAHGLELAQL